MSQRVRFGNLTSSDQDQWEQLLSASQQSTPFHSYEWEQVLRLSFPDKPSIYWGLWLSGELIAVWPTSLLPVLGGTILNPRFLHADYFASVPAIKDGIEMTLLRQLASDIVGFMKRRHRILSWFIRIPRNWPFVETAPYCGFEVRPGYTLPSIVLHTSVNPEILWKSCPHGGLRTCVRKAEREGLEVRESSDLCDLKEYFVAKYPEASKQPTAEQLRELSFWVAIHRLLMCRGKAKLFVTRQEDRIIGGAIVFFQNSKAYLWNMGSLQCTWRMHPNHILVWNMIKWAYNHGINSIDFGSGTKGSHYFVERNLTDYELVDQVALNLPIDKFRHQLQTSLETAYRTLHAWAPSVLTNWYCRGVVGIT